MDSMEAVRRFAPGDRVTVWGPAWDPHWGRTGTVKSIKAILISVEFEGHPGERKYLPENLERLDG